MTSLRLLQVFLSGLLFRVPCTAFDDLSWRLLDQDTLYTLSRYNWTCACRKVRVCLHICAHVTAKQYAICPKVVGCDIITHKMKTSTVRSRKVTSVRYQCLWSWVRSCFWTGINVYDLECYHAVEPVSMLMMLSAIMLLNRYQCLWCWVQSCCWTGINVYDVEWDHAVEPASMFMMLSAIMLLNRYQCLWSWVLSCCWTGVNVYNVECDHAVEPVSMFMMLSAIMLLIRYQC